jgi:hypothetical protein
MLFWTSRDANEWHRCRPPFFPQPTVNGSWTCGSRQTWRRKREDGSWEYKQDWANERAYLDPRYSALAPESVSSPNPSEAEERPMTVWIYVDTSNQTCDRDHLRVFADKEAAARWFAENNPEGVAFEHQVLDCAASAGAGSV